MLVFIRHAQRGDNQFPRQHSEVPFDPPITTESQATIAKAAEELLALFIGQKVTKVNIICSKFLRCLMTAEKITDILEKGGMQVASPSQIENQVGEYMREDWFKEYPLESLIYDGIYRRKYIAEERWTERKTQTRIPYPENYVMFHERIGEFKRNLKVPPAGEVTLVVTHGFVVREMAWRMNQVPNIMAEVPYCGYVAFTHDGRQDQILRSRL